MTQAALVEKVANFRSEGRLLEELGERLVATAEVAVVELIKNAYDADSSVCQVKLANNKRTLVIEDDGHGMTEDDFLNKWMVIATGFKQSARYSNKYERSLTGAKGLGRFAVRFLGNKLTLKTTAFDEKIGETRLLVADFNWEEFDQAASVDTIEIPYRLYRSETVKTGTILEITGLRGGADIVFSKKIRSEVLRMTSPFEGLERGHLATESLSAKDDDPGFNVILPEGKTDEDQYTGLAENVLRNFWTRVTISLKENLLSFHVYFDSSDISSFKHSQEYRSQLREGLFADIRFFPFRAGIFSGKNIDGRKAWRWVRENSGVGIIDHGFRVKPYGYEDDDWLLLSQSEAKSERYWRSSIMIEHFPIPDDIRKSEKRNPVLNLPKNHQLVGAVFIKNSSSSNFSNDSQGLIPSTDREGFRNNQAFRQVFDIVRGGIELMALQDKMEMERLDEEEAKKLAERAQKELDEAIREIEESQTLTAADKKRVITGYIQLREQIDQVDEYNRKSRQSLETMALLGVIAGFMTHESRRILENLRQLIDLLAKNLSKDPQAARLLLEIKKGYNEFSGHVSYASLFIRGIQSSLNSSFRVLPQVKLVVKTLEGFVEQKGISTLFDIQEDLEAPKVPIALYSGIVLNLYSNAVKAVMQGPSNNENPRIIIKSWNIPRQQILEIADNGIGIPRNLRSRIWDPLFTTTSRLNNPLGSGMGLGLSLVKKLLADIGGSISIVEPPPEYSTCFRVHIPRKPKEEDAGVD